MREKLSDNLRDLRDAILRDFPYDIRAHGYAKELAHLRVVAGRLEQAYDNYWEMVNQYDSTAVVRGVLAGIEVAKREKL